jgi:hypothetical protein
MQANGSRKLEPTLSREDLHLPDRFEALRGTGTDALRAFVYPVDPALEVIESRFSEIAAARRGGLTILHGTTGAGKSTFLNTVGLFCGGIITERVPRSVNVAEMLAAIGGSGGEKRVLVLEGREALGTVSAQSIEETIHAVNVFVRSPEGSETLVVWPANTEELAAHLADCGRRVGADALFGVGDPVQRFNGPPRDQYAAIATRTVEALNDGASLATLGISETVAGDLASTATTLGEFMGLVREALLRNGALVRSLMRKERYRMWTLVIAGNEPEMDVAALTRGSHGLVDVDRLLTATNANVVTELKRMPERIGLLATNLDARLLHMDMITALSIARAHGDDHLHGLMRREKMSTTPSRGENPIARLRASELGVLLAADALGLRRRGAQPGGGTKKAFESLARIASKDDGAINRAIGTALAEGGLISEFAPEVNLGTELVFESDLRVIRAEEPIRVEIMWRKSTSRAAIANYVLGKLQNYGRAIGYLDPSGQ